MIHRIPLNNCPIPEACPRINKLKSFFLVGLFHVLNATLLFYFS
ncbi:hypothetical protein BTH41_03923 [Bacillus mycoides]|nr:hypothetical protein BTH41_03923 [Bacillus mycoides]